MSNPLKIESEWHVCALKKRQECYIAEKEEEGGEVLKEDSGHAVS